VGAVACNPPWREGANALPVLYQRLVAEANRVVGPGGRIALLAAQPALVERPARRLGLAVERSLRVVVRGAGARIVVITKPPGDASRRRIH
jgi:16S rRNA G1207 methylase RsmC